MCHFGTWRSETVLFFKSTFWAWTNLLKDKADPYPDISVLYSCINLQEISSDLSMGVGRIISREGPLGDLSKVFPGGAKSGEVCFFPLKTKQTTFFTENFEIQRGKAPCPYPTLIDLSFHFATQLKRLADLRFYRNTGLKQIY